ncbi:MAG TPA: glycosyltransferase, partial [Gemmatimonadaceae bacterium]|nr:glycosyltransferase [Gemmatimonadaceae bacterium]
PAVRSRVRVVLLGGSSTGTQEINGMTVHSAGFVSDIDPAVAGLDMLWHPSKAEGLGTSIIDAMSLGVPPIAFRVGGIPEVIDHERCGLLVPPGDAAAFAAAAARLADDSDLRKRLSREARARAKSFDAAEMTKGTEAVYQAVLSG